MGRQSTAKALRRSEFPDPAMKPYRETGFWYELPPTVIREDLELATLIVRVGMASNALNTQLHAVRREDAKGALRTAHVMGSLVVSASLVWEALSVMRGGMRHLRPLALRAGMNPQLVDRVSQLASGKHPAHDLLGRVRKQLGFHWDAAAISPAVKAFGRNKRLVWLESDKRRQLFVHRLAVEVLSLALFPELDTPRRTPAQDAAAQRTISEALGHISGAMNLIIEFSVAATFGYLNAHNAERRQRESK